MALNNCEQPKICAEIFKNYDGKIKVANHRINDLEEKTEEINSINNILTELKTLTQLQREDSLKRDQSIQSMNKTQIEMINTLRTLSENLNKTDKSVEKLNEKVDRNYESTNEKFNEVSKVTNEKINEITDDKNISINYLIKKIITGALLMGAGAIASIVLK